MTYSTHEKALAIHRLIKCEMKLRPLGDGAGGAMEACSQFAPRWISGEDLMRTLGSAFKAWVQAWRVRMERNDAASFDATDGETGPGRAYFIAPENLERDYANMYDHIQEHRPTLEGETLGRTMGTHGT